MCVCLWLMHDGFTTTGECADWPFSHFLLPTHHPSWECISVSHSTLLLISRWGEQSSWWVWERKRLQTPWEEEEPWRRLKRMERRFHSDLCETFGKCKREQEKEQKWNTDYSYGRKRWPRIWVIRSDPDRNASCKVTEHSQSLFAPIVPPTSSELGSHHDSRCCHSPQHHYGRTSRRSLFPHRQSFVGQWLTAW